LPPPRILNAAAFPPPRMFTAARLASYGRDGRDHVRRDHHHPGYLLFVPCMRWPAKTRACTDDAPLDAHHAVRVAALARQRVVLHVQGVVILVLNGTRVVNLNRCVMK